MSCRWRRRGPGAQHASPHKSQKPRQNSQTRLKTSLNTSPAQWARDSGIEPDLPRHLRQARAVLGQGGALLRRKLDDVAARLPPAGGAHPLQGPRHGLGQHHAPHVRLAVAHVLGKHVDDRQVLFRALVGHLDQARCGEAVGLGGRDVARGRAVCGVGDGHLHARAAAEEGEHFFFWWGWVGRRREVG